MTIPCAWYTSSRGARTSSTSGSTYPAGAPAWPSTSISIAMSANASAVVTARAAIGAERSW